jgi:hypothetical protein
MVYSKHPDPPKPNLTSLRLASDEFDQQREKDLNLHCELGGELPSKKKTTCVPQSVTGKRCMTVYP